MSDSLSSPSGPLPMIMDTGAYSTSGHCVAGSVGSDGLILVRIRRCLGRHKIHQSSRVDSDSHFRVIWTPLFATMVMLSALSVANKLVGPTTNEVAF